MILFTVEALVNSEWREWVVIAPTKDAAIAATGLDRLSGVNEATISAHPRESGFVLESPRT